MAKKDPKWCAAMLDEMESIKINKVCDFVYLLPGLLGSLVRDRPQVCETRSRGVGIWIGTGRKQWNRSIK